MFILVRFSMMLFVYWLWGRKVRKHAEVSVKILEIRDLMLIVMLLLDIILIENIFI